MPLTGACAWKEKDLAPEERIDRFFNLIDHAVEGGVELKALYTRQHVKDFLLYTLHQYEAFCKTRSFRCPKDLQMPKLTLTSTFASSVVVGDPGILTVNLPPKETREVEATDVQIAQLLPQLEKLKSAGWLTFSVGAVAVAPVVPPVKVAEVVKIEVKPVEPPPPEPAPEPVVVEPPPEAVADPVVPETTEAPPAEATPAAAKPSFFDKKNRNR